MKTIIINGRTIKKIDTAIDIPKINDNYRLVFKNTSPALAIMHYSGNSTYYTVNVSGPHNIIDKAIINYAKKKGLL